DQIGLPLPKIHNLIKNINETEHTNKEQTCQATQTIYELSESQKANANEKQIFQTICDMTEQQKADANEERMFQTICNMPKKQKANALNLFNIMRYPKGRHANEIISPYLQKKAFEFVTKNLYQRSDKDLNNENAKLKTENKKLIKKNKNLIQKTQSLGASNQHLHNRVSDRISTIRSLIRKSKEIFQIEFK
ncbi:13708_t:CDS:1, partial [Gigaspora margarita]